MKCPNGWTDCSLCVNKKLCIAGLYKPEETTDLEVVIKAAEISERVVQAEVIESVARIKGNHVTLEGDMVAGFLSLSTRDRMNRFYGYRVQGLHHKDVIPLDGPSAPGGGSKSKVKKSKTGNKVYTDVWEGI